MAPPPEGAFATLLLILLATWTAAGHQTDLSRSPPDGLSGPTTMVLPLVFSYANTSRHATSEPRGYQRHLRQLQRAEPPENARMRLYDDLLSNGYYTTRLYIGTPPQEFALIVDSGSTVTYVPCSDCEQCGNHQDPRFQPELSSSYEPVKCNIDCSCDQENNQCTYERQYAEMSSSSGVLGEDVVSFGTESTLKPQRAVFGCENMETGDLFSQHADGIMGLGRGSLSIVDQLVRKGEISDSFSLCYGGMDIGGGAMALGDISHPPDMVFSRSDPDRSPYYNIELKEIHVSGEKLQLNPRIFNSKHGTILDSGTTYAYLPEAAYVAFKDAIMSATGSLKQIRGPDPTYKDICFAGAGSDTSLLSKTFPEVGMVFSNGQKLSLTPENYLFKHSKVPGAYCLGVFQNGKDPTTLLGGIVVRNTLVTYDRNNKRIGFWKTNCSELWDRLNLSGVPSPAPSDSFAWASQSGPSLAPATPPEMAPSPSVLPANVMQGPFRVGLVTFDMFISVNYSELAPRVMELRDLIANNLDVNASQVELVNLRSDGNGSLARWSIMPGSVGFMSNATAMAFIFRLSEHRVRFPDNFGSYKLIEWKVKPLSERTWLQQHGVALILAVVITAFIGFSAFMAWHLWRQRHESGTYRPVGAPIPEHELQPL